MLEIRSYQAEDLEAVIALILTIQREEFAIPISREQQPDLENIPNFYQQGTGNFWVALVDGKVVGTIALVDIGNQEAALRKMFVSQAYRGAEFGTAKQLLNTLLAWAKEQGLQAIYLGTTEKFLAAHRFYEKHGFEQVEEENLPENFPKMAVDKRFYRYLLSDSLSSKNVQSKPSGKF